MDCKEVGSVLFLFFDNEMEDDLLAPFRDHVATCGDCARQMDYTRKLLLVVRERCIRCTCPDGLRHRIVSNFPHRSSISPEAH